MCFFAKSHLSQPIVWSFKAKFANSIIMLEITKERANGCSYHCKPDFHRLSRAWHIRGKFSKRGAAAAAAPEQLDFCSQPWTEAGPQKFLTASCNVLSGLSPSRSPTCLQLPWITWRVLAYRRSVEAQAPGEHWGSFGGRYSVVCPLREDITAPKKVEENGSIHLMPSSVILRELKQSSLWEVAYASSKLIVSPLWLLSSLWFS